MFQSGLLKDRVALVTGGGTGLGLETATLLASLGAHVVIAGRRIEVAETAAAGIAAAGGQATALQLDVRDYPMVEQIVGEIVHRTGSLDILVNNAAGNFRCDTEKLSAGGWRAIVDIDLNGTFHCCRAAFTALSASPHVGRIISIISSYAWSGWPGCAPAAAAKAGIQSLMRTLAVEWGDRNILCNSVAPGAIADTEGTKRIHEDTGRGAHELARVPVGRFGSRADVAGAVAFLASPAGQYINGTDLVVDGGRQFSFAQEQRS
ncbi:SDR family oxidoreductase [Amycolatopsis acidicola]|uniref:SDR family oxidoreductase n=1 Tax=Amycolatopsis acidicola TaxID=2596893 RepID=A0A5N0V143_9PSEU|nr:SDR family oxidoreductase [Amycolatopsis acidicola]